MGHALFNRILAKDFSQSYFFNTIHRKNKNEACQVEDIVKVASQESGLHVPVGFSALHALVGDVGGETLVQPMTKSRFTRWDGKMDKSRSTVIGIISWRHKKVLQTSSFRPCLTEPNHFVQSQVFYALCLRWAVRTTQCPIFGLLYCRIFFST